MNHEKLVRDRSWERLLCGLAALHLWAGCGQSKAVFPRDAGGSEVDAADSPADVDASPMYAPGCPASAAAANSPCTPPQVCEYRASDAHPTCVTRLECIDPGNGAKPSWHVTNPDLTCGTRAPSCPSSYSVVDQGGPCPVRGSSCDYDEGRCECRSCAGDPPQGVWMCREWRSSDPGCPRIAPLAGTVCDTPDLFCTYDDRCGVSLGDDLKCTDGFWHRFVSAAGSCIIHACRKTPVDAGADHPPDTCAQASDCPGGTCWQQLDGARACVKPVPARPLTLCPGGNAICCLADADCTGGMNGRCLSLRDAEGDFCGRPIPTGNTCKYEECRTDADCGTHLPSAGPIVACLPSGAFGLLHATCVAGACRTDADCGLHPGGKCRFPLAAARGECGSATALFCAYPNDPCQVDDNTATPCPQGQLCAPADDLQGQVCRLPRTPA